MRRSCFFMTAFGLFSLFWSCQSGADARKTAQDDWLTPTYSASTFLVTSVRPLPYVAPLANAEKQAIDSVIRALEFGLFAFLPDGTSQTIGVNRLINNKYRLAKTQLITQSSSYQNVRQTATGFAMTMPVHVDSGTIALRLFLHKIEFGHDKQRALALAQAVFTHPSGPETDEQIRNRVKNCLAFYALYFKAIYANQLNQFKPTAVGMPIRFYNGGLRLANFEENRVWKGLYTNDNDARKAHRQFRKAIKSVHYYPERGDLILEYSVIFRQMSDFL